MNEQPQGTTVKMQYTGPEMATRGEYGERIQFGHMDSTGAIYVWDSTFGWFFWTLYQGENDTEWTPIIDTAIVQDGYVMHDGIGLEHSSQIAVNQYGNIEYDSWNDAVADGATIFVSDDGRPHVDAHRK